MSKSEKFHVQVTNPCSQSWEEMKTVPEGKFCQSCEKTVIDFSLLSDRQIIELLRSTNKGCGRFSNEQLNRDLLHTMPQSNSLIPAVLVGTALAAGLGLNASGAPVQKEQIIVTDSISPHNTIDTLPGYYALKEDLVVTGYTMRMKTVIAGGFICTKVTTEEVNASRLSFFRRILIALRLSKRPA